MALHRIEAFAPRCERRAARLIAVFAAAAALAGCTMAIPGFIDAAPTGALRPATYPFATEDWAKAEPAVLAAIRADTGDVPSPWSNEASGRQGAVAGVGARFPRSGATCRAFVARISEKDTERQIQGAACDKAGEVTLSDVAPFKGV